MEGSREIFSDFNPLLRRLHLVSERERFLQRQIGAETSVSLGCGWGLGRTFVQSAPS